MIIGSKDNDSCYEQNDVFEIKVTTVMGDRDEQQDAYGMSVGSNNGLAIICDGMGGYVGGKKASKLVVNEVLKTYEGNRFGEVADLLRYVAQANNELIAMKCNDTSMYQAGTTCVFVYIENDTLYWVSVGDSRVYIYRNGKYIQVTQDHNYRTVLNGQLNSGEITQEVYTREISKGESLINYMGISELKLIDYNSKPFQLRSGDKIVLMSDGLYKFLDEKSIFEIIGSFENVNDALSALETKVAKNSRRNGNSRDNMTVALINIK